MNERPEGHGGAPEGERDVPAPAWARLALVSAPFLLAVAVLLLLRWLTG